MHNFQLQPPLINDSIGVFYDITSGNIIFHANSNFVWTLYKYIYAIMAGLTVITYTYQMPYIITFSLYMGKMAPSGY